MCEARAALPFNAGALPRLLYLKTSNDDRDTPAGQLMWRLEASAAVEVFLNFRSEAHAGKALLACPDRHPLGMCHGLGPVWRATRSPACLASPHPASSAILPCSTF